MAMTSFLCVVSALCAFLLALTMPGLAQAGEPIVHVAVAPSGALLSTDYTLMVDSKSVPVLLARTLHDGPASFVRFDFSGKIHVVVTCTGSIQSAKIVPVSLGLTPTIAGHTISFDMDQARYLTLLVNDSPVHPLHLFADPLETDVPKEGDPNVVFFGPGVHEITRMDLKSNQTVYLASGSIVRAIIPTDEKALQEKDWAGNNKIYRNLFEAHGASHLRIRGRGVLDLSGLPWHARTAFVFANCDDVEVEGITILDAPCWDVAFFGCRNVHVHHLKQICPRENADGIDLCNTQDAVVEDCFLRNNDDEVCVKTVTAAPAPESKNILVQRCEIWNERARGLGITNETRQNISDVTFKNCDIIRDDSDNHECSALAILVSDLGTISRITFEDIRVEHSKNTLIRVWVGKDFWGHDPQRGHVNDVVFKNISFTGGGSPIIELLGFDAEHQVENVTIQGHTRHGVVADDLGKACVKTNGFVTGVKFE